MLYISWYDPPSIIPAEGTKDTSNTADETGGSAAACGAGAAGGRCHPRNGPNPPDPPGAWAPAAPRPRRRNRPESEPGEPGVLRGTPAEPHTSQSIPGGLLLRYTRFDCCCCVSHTNERLHRPNAPAGGTGPPESPGPSLDQTSPGSWVGRGHGAFAISPGAGARGQSESVSHQH